MKASTVILGALAAVATAAPAKVEERQSFNVNNLGFNSFNAQDFQYLGLINSLDFAILAQLQSVNNFNVLQFGNLFSSNSFDVQSLLEFQQLATLIQLAGLGAFNNLDLNGLLFNQLNFGLLGSNVFNFDFGNIIDQALIPQISQVISAGGVSGFKE